MSFEYLFVRYKYINNLKYYIYGMKINNIFYKIITKKKFNGIYHTIKNEHNEIIYYDDELNQIIILNQYQKYYLEW